MSFVDEHNTLIGIGFVFVVALIVVGGFYSIDKLADEAAYNQINQSREFANNTITQNTSIADKITISKSACDMYYTYSNKNECYEQVIKEHV